MKKIIGVILFAVMAMSVSAQSVSRTELRNTNTILLNSIKGKQVGTALASNFFLMGISNIVKGSNVIIYTNNGVLFIAASGTGGSSNWIADVDGGGYSLSNANNLTISGRLTADSIDIGSISGDPSEFLLGSNNQSGFRVLNPSVSVTQTLGVQFFASASVVTVDARSSGDWQQTNHAGAATTLVITNMRPGNFVSVKLPGSASGGSDYNLTVVTEPGWFATWFGPTNGATSLTRTNGQTVALEIWATYFNGSNVLNLAYGRSNTTP